MKNASILLSFIDPLINLVFEQSSVAKELAQLHLNSYKSAISRYFSKVLDGQIKQL